MPPVPPPPTRVALVGLDGFYFAQTFAARLRGMPEVALAGCCTLGVPDDEVAANCGEPPEGFAARYGLALYGEVDALLAAERPQAAVVATRPSRAGRVAALLAERGIHVFLAKPGVVEPAAAEEVRRAAGRGGACIAAGLTARLQPSLAAAARRVRSGEIGRPVALRIAHQHGHLSGWPAGCWYRDPAEGGPALFLGWYVIDLAQWLAGSALAEVRGFGGRLVDLASPFPDFYKAVGRLASGALVALEIHFGVRYAWPSFEVEVIGETGAVSATDQMWAGRVSGAGGAGGMQALVPPGPDLETAELRDWLAACGDPARRPFFGADDLVATVRGCRMLGDAVQELRPA
jgi:predicted dehydrogenase